MQKIDLNIDNHLTSILIGRGLISQLDQFPGRKLVLLVDENVYNLHKDQFKNRDCIIVPQGEEQKTLSFVESIFRKLVENEVDRTSFLVGVGGGLVTDLAGFVASTFMRGIEFGFISTTLLGQVDASIGGKNGVNLDGFKNMIGVIKQPAFVWCDLDLLKTLPKEELRSGFSEVIKYGAIRDKDLFDYLEEYHSQILSLEPKETEKIVAASATIKVQIVESDVLEIGDRKLLNYGHTMGHAIEKLTGMLHGEAIAIGMLLAARLSVNLGFLASEGAIKLEKLIASSGLPVATDIGPIDIYDALLKDKKRAGSTMNFVLLHSIGKAFVHKMDLDSLKRQFMICISIGNIELIDKVNAIQPELLELRYDLLNESPADIDKVLNKSIRQIATCRPGKYSDNQRINILKSAIDLGASYLDVEVESDDEYISELLAYTKSRDCDLILSYHNFDTTPGMDELRNILLTCYEKGGKLAKIACKVNNSKENARLLSLYELGGRKVVLGMGDLGKITRYAALDLGAEFTFVSIDSSTSTAPGQMTYDDFLAVKK